MFSLSLGPKIRRCDGELRIATSILLQLFLLGSCATTVRIVPDERLIHLRQRRFWCFTRRKRIPFDNVSAVLYGYTDWNPDSDFWASHVAWDAFTIGIRCHNDKEWSLASFLGPGGYISESTLPDWLDWDNFAVAPVGSQESESLMLAELLSKWIGVKIERPRE